MAGAQPLHLEALETYRRTLGHGHPDTLASIIINRALLFKSQGKLAETEPLHLEALEAYRRTLGHEHPDTQAAGVEVCALGSCGAFEGFLALRRTRYTPVYRQMGSLVLQAYRAGETAGAKAGDADGAAGLGRLLLSEYA